jgi:hypothetical protein
MSNLHKSNWNVSGNHMNLSVPFAKVDVERRLVSGFATLDNIDSQGDVVLAEASAKAFARARGNLREMHQPIAAGHLVDFQEEQFFDQETGKIYRGIFVTAYVSKGADSTWEKVLDGTLTGFSIGGEIVEQETQYVEDVQKAIRFVKDYDLIELSLVDNPANPLANVFNIQKSADGSVTKVSGMVADTRVENVFYCNDDKIARTAETQSADCLVCGTTMENIGWVEVGADQVDKVREMVTKHVNENTEGGVTVQKSENQPEAPQPEAPKEGEVVAGVDENREAETNTTETTTAEGQVNESGVNSVNDLGATENVDETENVEQVEYKEGEVVAGIDEVHDETEEVQKKMDSLMVSITEALNKNRTDVEAVVSALSDKIDQLEKSVDSKISEFGTKISELDTNLATAKSAVSNLENSVEKFNSSGAIKKSGEVENAAPEKVQKDDAWNGAFSVRDIFGRS